MRHLPVNCAECDDPIGDIGNGPAYVSKDGNRWLCERHDNKFHIQEVKEGVKEARRTQFKVRKIDLYV